MIGVYSIVAQLRIRQAIFDEEFASSNTGDSGPALSSIPFNITSPATIHPRSDTVNRLTYSIFMTLSTGSFFVMLGPENSIEQHHV
jgi:hypothetical protein